MNGPWVPHSQTRVANGKRVTEKGEKVGTRTEVLGTDCEVRYEKLGVKRKALSMGKDPHIRPPNPRILIKISILHVTCHHVSHLRPAPFPRLMVFHLLTPFQRPLFISEHAPPKGLLPHSSLSSPQRPPQYPLIRCVSSVPPPQSFP